MKVYRQFGIRSEGKVTDTRELSATVTTFWWASPFFEVLVPELSSWRLDDADFVRASIVAID